MKLLNQRIIIKKLCFIFQLLIVVFSFNLHAKEYFVAKTGNDNNDGSRAQPFLTINHAAQIAKPGDTINVKAGVYREWVNPKNSGKKNKRIVYQADPEGEVIITGSEPANGWIKENNLWVWQVSEDFFGDINPFNTLSKHPEYIEEDETSKGWGWLIYGRWTHRGDVFLNSEGLTEKEKLSELSQAFTWYTETEEGQTKIWANFAEFDPNKEQVEVNVRGQAFFPSKAGLSYITVKGFTIKNVANHWAPPTEFQPGAIAPNGGSDWVIEDNIIEYARAVAISIGIPSSSLFSSSKKGRHIIRNNIIWRPGQAGIAGQTWNPYTKVIGNIIEGVNYREEFGGWETAAIKFHNSKHVLIENNLIRGVYRDVPDEGAAHGIWVDFRNTHFRVTKNIVSNAEGEAILLEANWNGPHLIDNNIIDGGQVAVFSTRDDAWVHNLFLNVGTRWENQDYGGRPSVKNARWYNNIFVGKGLKDMPEAENYRANSNIYFDGAKMNSIEKSSIVSDKLPEIRILDLDQKVEIEITWPEKLSTMTESVLSAKFLELPIKNKKRKKLKHLFDFNGNKINGQGFYGPFIIEDSKTNRFTLIEYPEVYLNSLKRRESLALNNQYQYKK